MNSQAPIKVEGGVMPPLQAPSVLLMGEPGSGKTRSIATLAQAGLTVYAIITEPTGLESLLDTWIELGLSPELLRFKTIMPKVDSYDGLIKTARTIAISDAGTLASQKPHGDRANSPYHKVLGAVANFVDDRTGQAFGPVHSLPSNSAFVIDSLSGLSIMAMDLAIGDKVTASPGEWGLAMKLIQNLIQVLSSGTKCMFVMIAHVEPEIDETTGAKKNMVSTLGKKLAPNLPRFFSEVVLAHRELDKYYWATQFTGYALKHRALPLGSKLAPDFKPVYDRYLKRVAFANQTEQSK